MGLSYFLKKHSCRGHRQDLPQSRPDRERPIVPRQAQGARHSPPQLPAGGDRRRPHASAQAQGAQDQGTGEQEVEEADGNEVGGVQDVCCCCKAALFCFYVVIIMLVL